MADSLRSVDKVSGVGPCPCPGTTLSLIAFDVDKTVLHQGNPREKEIFTQEGGLADALVELARMGFNIAAVTGNSLSQLSARFLDYIIEVLCSKHLLTLVARFHFFCNGAALYIEVNPKREPSLQELFLQEASLAPEALLRQARELILPNGTLNPKFVVLRYAQSCSIPADDADKILEICRDEASAWWKSICDGDGKISAPMQSQFYIGTGDAESDRCLKEEIKNDKVNTEASMYGPQAREPTTGCRSSKGADGVDYVALLNMSPVLSFRHARNHVLKHFMDPRILMIDRIRKRMQAKGLNRYIVSPGGRGSIDISHHLVNKHYAVLWLLGRLGIEGVAKCGEPMGVNAIYFGDEVVIDGNDLPVAEIPGIMVFAVNELTHRVPFQNNIELPTYFTEEVGPEGTLAVLQDLLRYCVVQFEKEGNSPWSDQSALATWKELHMKKRLHHKIHKLMTHEGAVNYRRVESALAALTLLTRSGEGVKNFCEGLITQVNNLGQVSAHSKEMMVEPLHVQGGWGKCECSSHEGHEEEES